MVYKRLKKKLNLLARNIWELRFFLLLASTMLFGTFYAYIEAPKIKHAFRNYNKKILSTRIYIPDVFSSSFDPVLDRIYRETLSRHFDFTATKSSELVASFIKDHPEFATSKNTNYKNIFDLLMELYINEDHQYELIIFGDYIKPRLLDNNYRSSVIPPVLHYLETMYYKPISSLLRIRQFGRAKKYASRLNAIMRVLDTPPLMVIDPYTQERFNKLIMLNILVLNAKTLFSDVETIAILHDAINEKFKIINTQGNTSTREKIQGLYKKWENHPTSNIYKIISYWDGVYLMKQKDYTKAWVRFRVSASNHTLTDLRQASLLMQARCLFWSYIEIHDMLRYPKSETDPINIRREVWTTKFIPVYQKTTHILNILKTNSTYSNYRNDIIIYLREAEVKKNELLEYVSVY